MSARKIVGAGSLQEQVTLEGRQTRLSLPPDSVVFHRRGIEFRSDSPFSAWTEVNMELRSPRGDGRVQCSGVVIACTGTRHTGYHVSMVFTNVSRQAQARLDLMAQDDLAAVGI
jgi:hypothetical protein